MWSFIHDDCSSGWGWPTSPRYGGQQRSSTTNTLSDETVARLIALHQQSAPSSLVETLRYSNIDCPIRVTFVRSLATRPKRPLAMNPMRYDADCRYHDR